MIFKGHFSTLSQPLDFNKLTIFTKSDGEKFIRKEYIYEKGKVLKITDHINGIISEYEHLDDTEFKVRFYLFEDSISDRVYDSIKEITCSDGKEIKETLINIRDNKEVLVYTTESEYSGDYLIFERTVYHSDGEEFRIKHEWNDKKTINNIIHIDEPDKVKYTFNKNGFLIECLYFKYEGSVKKTTYEYKNDRLFKLVQFPHLEYKKTLFGKIKLIDEAQFMDETEYYYFDNGLLEKEVIKDYETKEIQKTIYYQYEK
ncbi:MAG: hypothetical protein CMC76_12560 [Flavobacteriaceae bacterium]|nr:hypothetical protein [Flavobacteriaceae bacterium]|tara:strand:- start:51 stop:824 length:774 start_codon:yes stop_codon:yes gene_type:complete